MKLEGKVALVTGSGRGIGKAIAMTLANEGADIIVNDVNLEDAEGTASEIRKIGRKAVAIASNVADRNQAREMFAKIKEEFGVLHILVNNAGITRDGLLLKLTEEQWDQVVSVNLKGVFHCCQLAAGFMVEQNEGKIVNLTSIAGQIGNVGQVNYAATKAGVIGMTKTLAKELARSNINVNAIAPGFIRTPMTDQIPEKIKESLIKTIPLDRIGEPEDIAKAVKFLVTDDSSYITGHILSCNGGMFM
ncbi:3-oxoacyl-ACP reductase FabG [Clostridiales bacterium BAD-6]|uniref:3-oxoacyl-[acyl-carrier-protein] reductase n=2 Tax=Sinanaerobacter chloroacetimidivorans TaxID=2818044 RepID=A0A8J7W2U7_9FIRM|nr:3-oxoacyl-ACP reductase FabG [Sinanaerobacter chloroacetimidivorans]MBR0599361.1 3-oxoacyl-ACP reductase FabG [Sinanaerobacter chloroacetimidivorans]